jgi:hypothetical protein
MNNESLKAKLKKINTENSIMATSQKWLQSELKRIDLEKRQYESNHSHEKRKIITKFAHKLMLSTSFNTNYGLKHPGNNERTQSVSKQELNNKSSNLSSRIDAYHSMVSTPVINTQRSQHNPITDLDTWKQKKNVSFYNDESTQNESLAMDQHVILPRVVEVRRSVSFANATSNNKAAIKTRLPGIFNEQNQQSQTNSKQFLSTLNDENSGFFICTNSKGLPICDGYDNYAALMNATTNTAFKFGSKSKSTNNVEASGTSFKDLLDFTVTSVNMQPKKKVNFENDQINGSEEKPKSSRRLSRRKMSEKPSSASLFKQILMHKKREEEDKICRENFKAQNIKSLTLKEINIY